MYILFNRMKTPSLDVKSKYPETSVLITEGQISESKNHYRYPNQNTGTQRNQIHHFVPEKIVPAA